MKIKLPAKATRAFHNIGFQLKKHSPEILVVTGIVGTVASAVVACKATTKLHDVLDESKKKIDMFHQGAEDGKVQSEVNGEIVVVDYTEDDCTRDITITYAKTGVEIAKLYAPAVLLGAASITSILVGHRMVHKRNLALAAAYTAVDKGFKNYRGRVVERFGDKLDKELLYNIKTKEVEETVVDENGKETIVKKTVEEIDPAAALVNAYTFCFSKETSSCWQDDSEANRFFLLQQQDWANDQLKSRGRLFLNEVLDMLGIDRVRLGQTVGWVYDEKNPVGDNFIDFGLGDIRKESCRKFMSCQQKNVWLDFNVDGDILGSL